MNRFLLIPVLLLTCCQHDTSQEQITKAKSLASHNDHKNAIVILNDVIKNDPTNIDALLDRGFYNIRLKQYDKAINDYSAILCCIDSKNTLALYNRALSYAELNDKKRSVADLNQAIAGKGGELVWVDSGKSGEVDPYDVPMTDLRYDRAIVLYEMNDFKKAFNDFSFCIQLNYMSAESYYYRGIIYLSYNDKENGCKDLTMARSLGDVYADTVMSDYCN